MLDVGRLATLRAVLAHGSFSAAGQALGLTQPAVSRQITLLERQARTRLVRRVRLGSFFTAFALLTPTVAALTEARLPNLDLEHELVDRRTAFRRLAAGELDLAIVFEHGFEPDPPPHDLELVPLFTDPARVLLPARHPLAGQAQLALGDLAGETWIRANDGSAARLLDHVLAGAGLRPRLLLAGHGDEPVEAQAFIAAGRGVTVAHELNMLLDPAQIVAVPLVDGPVRHIQAA